MRNKPKIDVLQRRKNRINGIRREQQKQNTILVDAEGEATPFSDYVKTEQRKIAQQIFNTMLSQGGKRIRKKET